MEEHAHKYTYLHYLKISLFTLRLVVILLLFGSEKGISIKKILSILLEKGYSLLWHGRHTTGKLKNPEVTYTEAQSFEKRKIRK